MLKKLIPNYYFKSIYDIPYDTLYAEGIRLILTDLDNTLISYKETMPNDALFDWVKKIKECGFELVIVSNSRKTRVTNFANALDVPCVKFSTKPLKRGIKKAIRKVATKRYAKNEIILLGDQLMTDIFGANRMKINSILIEAIDKKTDTFPTRFNRGLENHFLKKIKKKYPEAYQTYFLEYTGGKDDSKKV